MGLVFPKLHQQPLCVNFRRISTGDGDVPAGLDEVRLAETAQVVAELNNDTPLQREIIGSWYQGATVSRISQFKMFLTYSRNFGQDRKMEIIYDEKQKQFRIIPLLADSFGKRKKKSKAKEMTFEKPVGLVPLVGPGSAQTVAYYLAAAGGEWEPYPNWVSIVFVIL